MLHSVRFFAPLLALLALLIAPPTFGQASTSTPASASSNPWLPVIFTFLGVLLTSAITYLICLRNNRIELYKAVFEKKFETATRLMDEAEYLRRGLKEYIEEDTGEQEAFYARWSGIARELDFHDHQSSWILGDAVKDDALKLKGLCEKVMTSQRQVPSKDNSSDSSAIETTYKSLIDAVHKQTYLPELDGLFRKRFLGIF